ncbi:MAG: sugar ABC transporter substrate-binding protein [Nitrospirae bacterium GWD2_57_9]|nr:MAG: sugar ABC transporter substrate-binding protein [Nitrospirae bacterium GWD2_57_9]OGW46617.1 MAG: sugar ABC transporter substrate-binding protein [Nitrospirae bacterium GWC2_57_9]
MKTWNSVLIVIVALLAPFAAAAGEYVIGEGDTLLISVWGEKDLSLSVKVRPDGKVTLPAVGEVTASNTTARNLQATLASKLRGIVKNPVVTVIVMEITNNKVYIFGGGVRAGVYSLVQRTTLLQLLCQIEDAKKADLKRAYVLRDNKRIKTDFHKLFIQGETSEDITIEPNDVVFIPTNTDKNVYVMGAVNMPKFIEYRDGLTVMEAILEAGGFTKFANPNDTIIYRKDEQRKEITIPVKMKKLINDGDLKQNEKLKPGDYIVVKESIF